MKYLVKKAPVVVVFLLIGILLVGGAKEHKGIDIPFVDEPSVSVAESLSDDLNFTKEEMQRFASEGTAYIEVNNNKPNFKKSEITTESYEKYGRRDALGRCTTAMACVGKDIMPTEPRGAIGMVKPTGWHTIRYNGIVEGNYLYNRCHLIAFELTGENANEDNLITGTRYMNVEGMLPYENMVARYVKKTGNHVMYRVRPVFDGLNMVAHGVQIEGYSVEDNGRGISFNVFCPNIQPQIRIDYLTGESVLVGD